MTDQRELDRLLGAFFREGMDKPPDRVVDAALDAALEQIDHTRQWRADRMPRRFKTMPMFTRFAAAAIVGVLAIGGALYLMRPGPAGVSTSSSTPGASPSESASPSAVPSPTVVPARAPSWTATGSLATPRVGSTATLLSDGRVLVAGGSNPKDFNSRASAELYDPITGTWTATGSMGTLRSDHTATLLPDGRVLVTGGSTFGWGSPVASAELYDPITGTWTATGSMGTPRSDHTATLLPDGRVLVTGGVAGLAVVEGMDGINASAELYDPVAGTWTAGGIMGTRRYGHAATLLPDGRVLVAGGGDSVEPYAGSLLDSAELYDPDSGTWTATGTMVTIWNGATATLLPDGRVLMGGVPELYDPDTRSWATTGDTIIGWWNGPSTLLTDGRVLVLGAATPGEDIPTDTAAYLFDPGTDSWTAAGKLDVHRYDYTATLLLDGRVLVAGGRDPNAAYASAALTSAELYDPGSP